MTNLERPIPLVFRNFFHWRKVLDELLINLGELLIIFFCPFFFQVHLLGRINHSFTPWAGQSKQFDEAIIVRILKDRRLLPLAPFSLRLSIEILEEGLKHFLSYNKVFFWTRIRALNHRVHPNDVLLSWYGFTLYGCTAGKILCPEKKGNDLVSIGVAAIDDDRNYEVFQPVLFFNV